MQMYKHLVAAALAASSIGYANATPVTWVDTIDFAPDRHIVPLSSTSYTHDIRDEGYVPLVDLALDYSLSVNLYDNNDKDLEVALIDALGILGDTVYFELSGLEYGGWSLAGHAQLALTGLYDVTISSLWGDFYLGGSTLTVRGESAQSVPEPGSLALLVLALLAAAVVSRKRLRDRVA